MHVSVCVYIYTYNVLIFLIFKFLSHFLFKIKIVNYRFSSIYSNNLVSSVIQLPVFVVHVGVGPISQSDVDLAQACNACIVGFNVRTPSTSISQAAAQAGVKVLEQK